METLKYEQRVKETQKMIENVRIHEIEEEENWGKKIKSRGECKPGDEKEGENGGAFAYGEENGKMV